MKCNRFYINSKPKTTASTSASLKGPSRLFLHTTPAYLLHIQVDFVSNNDKWEVVGVPRTGLYQELIAPAVESAERGSFWHVVDKNAAVSAAVERNTKTLEPLLPRRVPYLHHRHIVYYTGRHMCSALTLIREWVSEQFLNGTSAQFAIHVGWLTDTGLL